MAAYKAHIGQIVEIAPCGCGASPTHLLIRPLDPDRWSERAQMSIVARAYCDACSPAVDHTTASVRPQLVSALPPAGWFERLITRWLDVPEPSELET